MGPWDGLGGKQDAECKIFKPRGETGSRAVQSTAKQVHTKDRNKTMKGVEHNVNGRALRKESIQRIHGCL